MTNGDFFLRVFIKNHAIWLQPFFTYCQEAIVSSSQMDFTFWR